MPQFLIELLSEEIPPHMQKGGGEELQRLLEKHLKDLKPTNMRIFTGARRIAATAQIQPEIPQSSESVRGPRVSAPQKAIEGFCRKYSVTPDNLTQENDFYVFTLTKESVAAEDLISQSIPQIIRHFSWPKSMRWGQGSHLTWIRPLRRILCLIDDHVVPFSMATDDDNGHGLKSSNLTQGHRFLDPQPFAVPSADKWEHLLYQKHVIAAQDKRRELIEQSLHQATTSKNLSIVDDPKLLDEVNGMVEWPVIHIGSIDPQFMVLPPEVLRISMRHHQKYFSLTDQNGKLAPYFAFVANMITPDHGKQIVIGNERVLRARFADGLYFFKQDQKHSLASRVPSLKRITFQDAIGSQYQRTQRLEALCEFLAPLCKAPTKESVRAAHLSKADLTTDMVGEFPELQGVMGYYYAQHDKEEPSVAKAIGSQYLPAGPHDDVPTQPVAITLGIADRIDSLTAFFAAGKKPTGSKDPFALRRAALGLIRLIRKNHLELDLIPLINKAQSLLHQSLQETFDLKSLVQFILERFQVLLRQEGVEHDRISAILAGDNPQAVNLCHNEGKIKSLSHFLTTPSGRDLVAAYKRAKNILQIENKKDKTTNAKRLMADEAGKTTDIGKDPAEKALDKSLEETHTQLQQTQHFSKRLDNLSQLCQPINQFFEDVLINDSNQKLRDHRLALLARFVQIIRGQTDLSKIQNI